MSAETENEVILCPMCHEARVPNKETVCSAACGVWASRGQVLSEWRVPFEKRPKPGEKWSYMGNEVWITTVDEAGCYYKYVRLDFYGLHFGQFGQLDVMNPGNAPDVFPCKRLETTENAEE